MQERLAEGCRVVRACGRHTGSRHLWRHHPWNGYECPSLAPCHPRKVTLSSGNLVFVELSCLILGPQLLSTWLSFWAGVLGGGGLGGVGAGPVCQNPENRGLLIPPQGWGCGFLSIQAQDLQAECGLASLRERGCCKVWVGPGIATLEL